MRLKVALALLCGLISATSFGQRLLGVYQNDGTLQLLADGRSVLNARFWVFNTDWTSAPVNPGSIQGDGSVVSTLSVPGGQVNFVTRFTSTATSTTIHVDATPTVALQTNSDNLNLMLDPAYWVGSTAQLGSTSKNLSATSQMSTWDVTGQSASLFRFTRSDGLQVTFTAPSSMPFTFQDSRRYNLGWELRACQRTGNWPAFQTRSYELTLTSNTQIAVNPAGPVTIQQGTDWIPVTLAGNVAVGSALDWSSNLVGPAGAKGWLKANAQGQFYYETAPTTTVRFNGTNLGAYACYPPTHALADELVDKLAKMGYNAVRLHHIDYPMIRHDLANTTTIDAEMLDKLHYLISKLKQRGFMIAIDLWSLRLPNDGEIYSGHLDTNNYKALMMVDSGVRQHWWGYANTLLNTVNPYTGLAWKNEPAIGWMTLVNENVPTAFTSDLLRPDVQNALEQATGGMPWDPTTTAGAQRAVNLGKSLGSWMTSQLRGIGVKAMITDSNTGTETALIDLRSQPYVDFVDTHWYPPHAKYPNGDGQLPFLMENWSLLQRPFELGNVSGARVYGKPLTLTEYATTYPNQYRGELGLILGSLASVQQWNGIWSFCWIDNFLNWNQTQACDHINLSKDPIQLASERAAIALFSRGDMVTSDTPNIVQVPVSQGSYYNMGLSELGKGTGLLRAMAVSNTLGSLTFANPLVNGISTRPDGQLVADYNALTLKVNTNNTCGIIASPDTTLTAGILTATPRKARATVWVTSIDKRPITQSKRMLLVHLTDVQNSGATYADPTREVLTSLGTLPHLARNGDVDVTVKMQSSTGAKVYRLNSAGVRIGSIAYTKTSTSITFKATTKDPASGTATFYYEIIR